MRPTRARRITTTAIALAIALAACSFNNGYVTGVTIDGGDRTLALGDPLALTATVVFGNGATDRVTWTSSDDTIATVDTTGLVTTLAQGPTQITATSTSDPSKNDTITLTINEPNAVTNLTIDGGDRTIVLGDPLTLTATITTTGTANDAITWTSSDQTVATIDAAGTVTTITDGTTDLTATSVFDPTQSDTITLTIDPPGALRWTQQFGTAATDIAYGVATDANGNVYVAGATTGDLEGSSAGTEDAFLRAYDPNGNDRWTRQFGTTSFDRATGVATDANGNIYVTGTTFGGLVGTSNGNGDAFLLAFDPSGTVAWTRQFGTVGNDFAYGVATDANGNIYVIGYTTGDLDSPDAGGADTFLRAYDAEGNVRWTRQFFTRFDGFPDLTAYAIAAEANGNVYVAGSTNADLDGPRAGFEDAFLRAYDTEGNVRWTRQFGTIVGEFAVGVAVDASGNAYLVGYTFCSFNCTQEDRDTDLFLRAYAPDGTLRWTRDFGTSAFDDDATGVATDTDGNVYVTGRTGGTLGDTTEGGEDAFLRAYDADGNVRWTRQFGTSTFDSAQAVATGTNRNVYVTGTTDGTLEGTSAGGLDGFLRAYGR